jgi:hypothetical protein
MKSAHDENISFSPASAGSAQFWVSDLRRRRLGWNWRYRQDPIRLFDVLSIRQLVPQNDVSESKLQEYRHTKNVESFRLEPRSHGCGLVIFGRPVER